MKKFCSQSIRRAKTDKIDSIKIASFGITYWSELTRAYEAPNTYDELKFLARQYYQVTGMLVKSKVNFSNLLDQVMPKINDVLSNQGENHKLTEFVSRYIHFQNILDMGERKFTSDYCKWAKKKGYRCNERKAIEIYALAQNGIPTLPNSQSVKIAVSEAVKMIHSIEESRNTILAQCRIFAIPCLNILLSSKWIVSAIHLLRVSLLKLAMCADSKTSTLSLPMQALMLRLISRVHSTLLSVIYPSVETVICEKQATRSCNP